MTLHCGDCLDVMRTMPYNSVDLVLTDPPYGLAFMGKKWDYDVPAEDVWAEALRVLKPGGHLLAFAGTRTQHRMACRIEDAGFEIRDMLAWVYGQGFPKSHNGPWGGTALKPALEPITMARKPLIGTVAANVLEHGTGALNIDECRVETTEARPHRISTASLPPKNALGGRLNGSKASGTTLQGRWPANLIHDGSDEVVEMFPQSKSTGGQSSIGAFRNGDIYGKGRDEREKRDPGFGDSGSAARFFYCAKASKRERGEGNNHPTIKPIALMEYLVKLASRPDAVVLDPFMGSGTTGIACANLGRKFIGIEREPDYFRIAEARINHTPKMKMDFGLPGGRLGGC